MSCKHVLRISEVSSPFERWLFRRELLTFFTEVTWLYGKSELTCDEALLFCDRTLSEGRKLHDGFLEFVEEGCPLLGAMAHIYSSMYNENIFLALSRAFPITVFEVSYSPINSPEGNYEWSHDGMRFWNCKTIRFHSGARVYSDSGIIRTL